VSRIGGILVAVLVALVGIVGLILFFQSRDSSTTSRAKGPGQEFADQGAQHLKPGERPGVRYDSNPPTSGPHVPTPVTRDATTLSDDQVLQALELGNVVLFYGSARAPAEGRRLAGDVAGAFSPALAAAGQAIVLARRPGTSGIVAAAWGHLERAPGAGDPRIRAFAEYWLGRRAG
jgi:Protein of unknown function (DUF3105)